MDEIERLRVLERGAMEAWLAEVRQQATNLKEGRPVDQKRKGALYAEWEELRLALTAAEKSLFGQ